MVASGSLEQVAPVAPTASSPGNQDVLTFFVSSFNDITDQLGRGVPSPIRMLVVFTLQPSHSPSSALSDWGGIDIWEAYIGFDV